MKTNGIAALELEVIFFVNALYKLPEKNSSSIRLTFVDDYFDKKWEEKVIFLCIVIRKSFLNDCPPVIQLFPLHKIVFLNK